MTLRAYSEYRESGLRWLGSIPAHWDLIRTKHLFSERVSKGFPDEPLLAATQTKGVVPKEQYENRTVVAMKDLHLLKLVEQGDYVISLRSFQGGIEFSYVRGIISPAYTILKASIHATPDFFRFFFKSKSFVDALTLFVTGIRQGQNIDYSRLSREPLPVPSEEEQLKIGRFLRHFVEKINQLIRFKQNLIRLHNEQKQSIIHHAVTRGLDPNVPLKASGVEWLGEVPEHWNIKPAKHYFREIDNRSLTGEEELLSVSHITGVSPRSQKNITMFMAASYVGHKLCQPEDLVINTMWAWMGAMGVARQTGIVSPSYAVYRPRVPGEFLPDFIDYLLRTRAYVSEYICRSTGIRSSRLRLYPEQFLKIPIVCPSATEQGQILDFIRQETVEVDNAIGQAQREIDLFREYRTRFIADVVTGKLDVRGVELPEIDEIEDLEPRHSAADVDVDELDETEEAVYADD